VKNESDFKKTNRIPSFQPLVKRKTDRHNPTICLSLSQRLKSLLAFYPVLLPYYLHLTNAKGSFISQQSLSLSDKNFCGPTVGSLAGMKRSGIPFQCCERLDGE